MRVFKTKVFARFARKNSIGDPLLCDAVHRAHQGLVDAELGAGLIKQRIARTGGGKSGGFRTIIALRTHDFACLLYGFAKSDRENVDATDLSSLRDLASRLLLFSTLQLDRAVNDGNLIKVNCHEETLS